MNKELKPLAQRITQGDAYHWQGTRSQPDRLAYFGVKLGPGIIYIDSGGIRPDDAELIAEAFNVSRETGRTPRQLADDLQACVKFLEALQPGKAFCPANWQIEACKLLNTIQPQQDEEEDCAEEGYTGPTEADYASWAEDRQDELERFRDNY